MSRHLHANRSEWVESRTTCTCYRRFLGRKTIAEFIKDTKRVSSNWIQKLGTSYVRFSWQAGYGCFSVSEMELDQIVEYIDNQKDHHRLIDFKEEYKKLLRDHGIEFDERYVWD